MPMWVRGGVVAYLVAIGGMLLAAERRATDSRGKPAAAASVEMFQAIESNAIDVKLIPKDATEARVIITNKTDKPLTVRLPEAFAGVPVLAQNIGGGAGRAGGAGGGANNTANQSMGGGMGMMGGMGMGMGGMGGGMMNIPAEKVAQFKVPTVCLEHGKKDPRPGIPYEIRPIEAVTTKPEVKQLLVAFGKQRLSQRATQAAAWHLANGLAWEQLAAKRIVHLNGTSEPWFSPAEIHAGMQIARTAVLQAEVNAPNDSPKSPGESVSLSETLGKIE
jgi:hypothetical protein